MNDLFSMFNIVRIYEISTCKPYKFVHDRQDVCHVYSLKYTPTISNRNSEQLSTEKKKKKKWLVIIIIPPLVS